MTDDELIRQIEQQRALMIAVATGGPRINRVDWEYRERQTLIQEELQARGIPDPNPHEDLWQWYGTWSGGGYPSYQSRRLYISELYGPLIERIRRGGLEVGSQLFAEPTGWARVDRGLDKIRERLESAETEEEFQTVGLLCRETLISLAQAVYVPERHPSADGVRPSETDANRMLEGYIATELLGGPNEEARRHARAALALAIALQHRRTASFRDAALCAEATASVVNSIAIVSGRRDPRMPDG
jgi:hypothetical protein